MYDAWTDVRMGRSMDGCIDELINVQTNIRVKASRLASEFRVRVSETSASIYQKCARCCRFPELRQTP